MELRPQFDTFLRDIRPSERNKQEWRTGSATLRSRLLADPDLSPLIVSTFLQGSVRRSTAVRPTGGKRSDVDVVTVTTIDHNQETPAVAMKRFEPFLERHYSGKWTKQDRSYAIELSYVDLDLVVTALPTAPDERTALAALYKSEAVQTLDTLEERNDWRLNKNWREDANPIFEAAADSAKDDEPASAWQPHPLMLPDRTIRDWGPTHPLAQIAWAAQKNRACNGHFVNVVRSIKWWRHEHTVSLPKYPKGYPLEHMIGIVLPDDINSVAEGLTLAFEGIRDTFKDNYLAGTVPVLPDHGVPSHDVMKRVTPKDFRAFYEGVAAAAGTARKALDSTDAVESGELWQGLLGKCFPLPDPSGGDRTRGLTAPAAAAQPRQTPRFA